MKHKIGLAAVVGRAATKTRFAWLAALLAAVFVLPTMAQIRDEPLPPEEVFIFSANSAEQSVQAIFTMPEDFYLYRNRFLLTTATPGFRVEEANFPPAITYEDEFFGETEIYYHGLTIAAQVSGQGAFELQVISQGCDKQLAICYPPQSHIAALRVGLGEESFALHNSQTPSAADFFAPNAAADEAAAAAAVIADKNLLLIMLTFFGFGLLLSFTPCVLPMVPILLGILGGSERRRALSLTASYIGGVAMTYTALGVAAGLSGRLLAPFLQKPPILIFSAFIFVALALSMFGLYNIQLPAFLRRGGAKNTGGVIGAFMMGALSAAVVSPCIAAPLIGALIYIGNTGDATTGGAALLSMSLGMSVLLLAAGSGGAAILPRAGAWMNDIKQLLGAFLLAAAVWILSSLLPIPVVMLLYGALLIFCGVVLGALSAGNMPRMARVLGVIVLLWGGAMIIGAASGGRDPLSPLSHFTAAPANNTSAPSFKPVQSLSQLRQLTAAARRPVMLEFYADWCVSCKEMEKFTFADERVRRRLQNMLLLRADITADTAAHRQLLKQFGLYGPPAILFFAPGGEWMSAVRVNGYQSAARFLKTLTAAGV